jgi:cAMP-dependent protein kinase regulator|tara:strand:- start:118 stop:309 length:192 start_codon:yes stop_codon:yes gene_type:complete
MEYNPGDYFGELALLKGEPRAANVIASSDCKLIMLDRKSFKRLLGPLDDILKRNMMNYNNFMK